MLESVVKFILLEALNSRWFRHFHHVSVFGIVTILSVAYYGLWFILVNFTTHAAEHTATHVSSALSDDVIQEFIRSDNTEQTLHIPQEEMSKLDKRMRQFLASFNMVKIKIYDTKTRIIYSTDPKIIGKLNTNNAELARALNGFVVSERKSKDSIWDLEGEQRSNVEIVETYVPIHTPEGKIVGCFEIYKDITKHLAIVKNTLIQVGVVLLVTVLITFAALMFVINRAICAINSRTGKLMAANKQLQQEITERKKVEEALENLNAELEATVEKLIAANRELQDFAHIAAHDLKEPSRGIGILASIISADYNDKLDEQGQEQLRQLIGKTKQMSKQIDSILQYSELGRVTNEKEKVDLNAIVKKTIDEIAPPENIKITIENELPTIMCKKTRMIQVFENLLSNAVKYMDKPKGQIKIGCVEEDGFWKFSVADNGPGIKERYFEKIFQIFQKLSPWDKLEGTGIGLTLVRKIVELYDGKTWVESKLGEGSTFFFTLPKQKTEVKDTLLHASTAG